MLGAGGDLVLDGGQRMRGWGRSEALAGVRLYGFGGGKDFFFCFGFGHAGWTSCVMVQGTPDRRYVYGFAEEIMKVAGRSGGVPVGGKGVFLWLAERSGLDPN